MIPLSLRELALVQGFTTTTEPKGSRPQSPVTANNTASDVGTLTQNGLLFPGVDFEKWYNHRNATGRDQMPPYFDKYMQWPHKHTDCRGSALGNRRRSKVCASFLLEKVSHCILCRIPNDAKEHALELKVLLQEMARPFRLMDLPAELRLRVLEMVIEEREPKFEVQKLDGEEAHVQSSGVPVTSHVCQELRADSLKLFYNNCKVELKCETNNAFDVVLLRKFGVNGREDLLKHIFMLTRTLVEMLGQQAVQHLRHVTIRIVTRQLDFRSPTSTFRDKTSLSFELDPRKGLGVEIRATPEPDANVVNRMQEHVASIESNREVLNVSGEAIISAIMGADDLAMWCNDP